MSRAQALIPAGKAVRLRCKACDWTMRVDRASAGEAVLYHRDVTCPAKMQPGAPTKILGSVVPFRQPAAHKARPAARRCATCRDELYLMRDAWVCDQGCTNEARM